MRSIQRMLACLLCLFLLAGAACADEQQSIGYQEAHRFSLSWKETSRPNGSQVKLWQIETVQDQVSEELNAIARAYVDELAPGLKAPRTGSSRLTVSIRPSRTGLSWMSFMVQARDVYQEQNQRVAFTTRTYDMSTGERIVLSDLFEADIDVWPMLQDAVREGIHAYWQETSPDAAALEAACSREAIEQMDFTLHGMSLVLHLNAADFYPGKPQLMEITLFYPALYPFMTEKALQETDNAAYYKTVALTYDDGPNAWVTLQILDVLLNAGERATFFLVGERIPQQRYLVQREHDEGHAIASHNYRHVYANETALDYLRTLPPKVDAVHRETIGIPVRYARAPGGQWENLVAADAGWPLIQWSVGAEDYEGESGPPPAQTAANIVAGTDDGGIILMHDLRRNSIEASTRFIATLQKDGYLFLTVDELFAMDGVTLEPNTPYWRCTDGKTTR